MEPWEPLEPWEPWGNLGNLGNLYLGTFTWEPLLGNLYLGTFNWEPLLGNLYLGTWEPGNLYLGTFNWEPLLGNLGTFTWEPLLGNLYLEPGNLGGMGFGAAPVCSETFTMAEDPKASAVGEALGGKMIETTNHLRSWWNLRNPLGWNHSGRQMEYDSLSLVLFTTDVVRLAVPEKNQGMVNAPWNYGISNWVINSWNGFHCEKKLRSFKPANWFGHLKLKLTKPIHPSCCSHRLYLIMIDGKSLWHKY